MKLFKPYMGLPKEVYVIFFSKMINSAGLFVFPLLTLILRKKIGLSIPQTGALIAISGLVFAPAGLIGGKLADTSVGRKKIIVIFDFIGALILLSCAFIEPSMKLVYMILFSTFAFGIAQPAHDALLTDVTNPENRNGAFSLAYLGFNLGFIVGPVVGGMLFENHLKLFFTIDALTGFIALALILLFIKETIGLTDQEFDEKRVNEKKIKGSTLKVLSMRPVLIIFALILFGYHFSYSQWGFMMPIHISEIMDIGYAKFYGRLAGFNGLVVIIFTPILTSALYKFDNLQRIIIGGVLYVVGFGILGFYNTSMIFIFSVFIFTLGEILITISYMPFVANHTPASHRGRISAILPIIMGSGYAIGPLVMGNVIELTNVNVGWKIIGIVMIIATIAMVVLEITEKKKAKKKISIELAEEMDL